MTESPALDALGLLLEGRDPASFFNESWERRATYLPGRRDRFRDLLDRKTFLSLLPRTSLLKAGFRAANGWYTDLPINHEQVPRLLEAGMGLCATRLPEEGNLGAFLESYRQAVRFAGVANFNGYMSPDGLGFSLHADDHPVWILQIDGAKRWWFSETPGVPHPASSFSFPPGQRTLQLGWGTVHAPDEDTLQSVVLEPGDVLYLPAGCWHRTQAIGGSLGLTLATFTVTPSDLLQALLSSDPAVYKALRQQLPLTDSAGLDANGRARLRNELAHCLSAITASVTDLSPDRLLETWDNLCTKRLQGNVQSVRAGGHVPADGAARR